MKRKSVLTSMIGLIGFVSLLVAGSYAGGGAPAFQKPDSEVRLQVTVFDTNPSGSHMGIRSDGGSVGYATYIDGISNVEAYLDKWGSFHFSSNGQRKIYLDWTPHTSLTPPPNPPDTSTSTIDTFRMDSNQEWAFLSLSDQANCLTTGRTRCTSFMVAFPKSSDNFWLQYQWGTDWSQASPTAQVWVTRTGQNTWILQSSGLSECGFMCPSGFRYQPDIAHLWGSTITRGKGQGRTDRGYFIMPIYIEITAK